MTLTRFEFTDRARPLLEVGIGSTEIGTGAGVWDVSLWDAPTSTWNGDEPLWRDVSCDGIEAHIELGRGRITDPFPVGTADVVVSNESGWADPSLDFEVDSAPGYFSLPGTAGNYVSVDDYPALAISGDMCIVLRFRTSDWPPPYLTGQIAAQNLAWAILIEPTGALEMWTVSGGVLKIMTSDPVTPTTDWRWYSICLDVDNGAGGHDWKVWYGGNDESTPSWQEFDSRTAAGTIPIDDSTLPLVIGTAVADGFHGDVSHLSVRSGTGPGLTVGGTEVFRFDGWNLQTVASSSMPDIGPNPMVVNQSGDPATEVVPALNPAGSPILELRPGRPIRIGVEHDTLGKRWRFNGFIDEILPVDDPEDWSTVTLRCIDALGEAGRPKLKSDVETGASEQVRTRFARILNTITWPTTKRSISTSAIRQLYAAELDGQVVDLLRQTAESDGGWCFGDDQGRVVLQHRDWLYHETGQEPDGIIGNFGDLGAELLLENGGELLLEQDDDMLLEDPGPEVCPGVWQRSFARSDIATQVVLDRDFPDGVTPTDPVIANDFPAQVLYGIEPYERNDLWTLSLGDLQQIAGRILATRKATLSMPRISSVTVSAAHSTSDATDVAVDLLAGLSIFTPSRFRGRLRTTRGAVFDANFFAVGVVEDISADAWTAEISLDRSRPFEVLDPVDYVWDTARWDRSLWN